MKLSELSAFLFPYRTHLELELAYTKEQLAQSQRRADILQADLISMKRPQVVTRLPAAPKSTPVPKGWDATRAAERNKPHEPREAEPQDVSAGPDAGSEGAAVGDGAEAVQ